MEEEDDDDEDDVAVETAAEAGALVLVLLSTLREVTSPLLVLVDLLTLEKKLEADIEFPFLIGEF